MARSESLEHDQTESGLSPGSAEEGERSIELRRVPAEIRGVSFPVSLRGYEREAVDAYVRHVDRLIAELDASGSPEAAVKHALEQVGEQTRGLLEQAGQTAEEITVGARREAEERTARASAEAETIVSNANAGAAEMLGRSKAEAETIAARAREEAAERLKHAQDKVAALQEEAKVRMRRLEADTENIRQRRHALLDDLRGIAAQVAETASNAEARFPRVSPATPPEEETLDLETDKESPASSVETAEKPRAGRRRQAPSGR